MLGEGARQMGRPRFFVLLLLFQAPTIAQASPEDLIEDVRLRHRAAINAIRSLSCTLAVRNEVDGKLSTMNCQYWRSGETIRARKRFGNSWCDILVRDMKVTRICPATGAGGTPKKVIDIHRDNGMYLGLADPWINALFCFSGETGQKVEAFTFEELADRFKVNDARRVTEGRYDKIVVELQFAKSTREYWFDGGRNYLVSRVVSKWPNGSGTNEVMAFNEGKDGVSFPSVVVTKSFVDGNLQSERTATFSDLQINGSIPAQLFRVDLPANSDVFDQIVGKKFVTDSNGVPTGPGTALDFAPPPGSGPGQSRTATISEPTDWMIWILPASLAVLLTAGLVWMIRRRRQPNNPK